MDKQQLLTRRGYFDLVHGVTVRAIGALADNELDFRPKPGMRTPRELVFHIYAQEKALAEAARLGKMSPELANASNPEDASAAAALNALTTVNETVEYAKACHAAADAIFRSLSEEELPSRSNRPSEPTRLGNTSSLPTTSTGTIAGSFIRTCGCSGRNRRCCTTTSPADAQDEETWAVSRSARRRARIVQLGPLLAQR